MSEHPTPEETTVTDDAMELPCSTGPCGPSGSTTTGI